MRKIILLLGVFFITLQSINAQIIFSDDTTICSTQPFLLAAVSSSLDSLNTDDINTGTQDIGFPFTFYGNTYTKLVVSSNGFVTFDTTNAGGNSAWVIGTAIPNPGNEPENAIMAPWHDTDPNIGGVIYFGSFGVAPNRVYIVTWCAIPMYSFSCNSMISTSQVLLYEGSNRIEMNIQDKPLCLAHNAGAAVQGLVDVNSNNFDIVTDPASGLPRDFPLPWIAANEGWEFIPNSPTSYTINQIPFQVPAVGSTTWYNAAGDSLGTGPYLNVNPIVTTTYYAEMPVSCSGISFSDSVTITINSTFNINASVVNTSCLGNDGSVTLFPDIMSTQPPWDIDLLDANNVVIQNAINVTSNSFTFSNLFPGTYIVRVFDAFGCSSQKTFIISQFSAPIAVSSSVTNVSCYDNDDAKIGVNAQGGLLPYRFFINGVLNSNPFPGDSVFSGLTLGTYIVSVMDDNDCLTRDTIIITAPNSPLQAITSSKTVLCHSDSLSEVVVSAVGGTGPYSYLWYNSSGGSPSSVISSTDIADSLSSGIYFVVVTDANGCDTTSSVQVLSANTSLFSTTQISEVVCKGDASGYLIADAGGGFAPYTYKWSTSLSGGVPIKTTSGVYTTDTLQNISSDIYLLDITDHLGCKVSQMSLTVNEPLQALVIDNIYLIDSIACFGDNDGRALGVKSGGDPSYTYLWDNGESTLEASNLPSGYRTLSVIDYRGCEVLDSIYIPESSEIISSLVIEESISCYGSTNAFISVSTFGGYPLYLYSWSNQNYVDTGIVDTAFALSYGVYALTTEDSLGCSVVDSVYLSEPDLLTMEAKELSWVSCKGLSDGLAFSTAYGGTLPYTFNWEDSTGTVIATGRTINTLSAGLHTVVVTDARGCSASDTVLIHEPLNSLTVDISVLDSVYCNGASTGILGANTSGGTPFVATSSLYTYLWDDALQASQTTAIATNLSADVYTVVVTDSRGCTATAMADITNVTNTMYTVAYFDTVSCYGLADASASVVALGGYAPYVYSWVGPNGYTSSDTAIFNLAAGTHSVTVEDANNCTRDASVDIFEPLGILFDVANSLDESCAGACDGLIYIDYLSGGTLPYTAFLTNTDLLVTQHVIQSSNILLVCSGEYTVDLTDANGCESSVLFGGNDQAVVSPAVILPTPSISLLNSILCFGASTGELAISLVDTHYTYIWESLSDSSFNSFSDTISNLLAGDYVVTVQYTDSLGQLLSGCNLSDTLNITDGNEIFIGSNSTNILCYGDNTGVISTTPSAGLSPYTYSWVGPNGYTSTDTAIFNLSAGTYSVIVTDSNDCEQSKSITIEESPELIISIDSSGYVLEGSATGGVSPYSFSWRKNSQPAPIPNTGITYNVYIAGTYYLLVTDANGCEVQSDSILYVTPPSWDCINNACINPGNGAGVYVTQAACDAACGVSAIDETSTIALSIYPNPFTEETTVDFGREVKQASVRVVDVFGKLIEEYSVENTNKYILKRENKASGIYFVEIEVEGLLIKQKLIIE